MSSKTRSQGTLWLKEFFHTSFLSHLIITELQGGKMYLKRLDIQGFKSFADKTTLEFRPGVTAVIGPNGSGKSNVSDSVRWVLGEQSMKSLRGSKSHDIIFAGTENRRQLGFAEVNLTMDNSSGLLPVSYDGYFHYAGTGICYGK